MHPHTAFQCVADLFSVMDRNKDGELSRFEYEGFSAHGLNNRQAVAQEAQKHALDIVEDAVMRAQSAEHPRNAVVRPSDENNPLVWLYLVCSCLMLSLFACTSMSVLIQQSGWDAKKEEEKAKDQDKGAAGDGIPVSLKVIILSSRCNGNYTRLQDASTGQFKDANGFPVWKKDDSEDYIFSGVSGQWVIGDEDERDENFDTDTGNVSTLARHNGAMPNKVTAGTWQRFDDDWEADPAIKVMLGQIGPAKKKLARVTPPSVHPPKS